MARRRNHVQLTPEQQEELHHRLETESERDGKKMRVILEDSTGVYTLDELATQVSCPRSMVQQWLERYRRGGLEGLLKRRGRSGRTSALQRREVNEAIRYAMCAERFRTLGDFCEWLRKSHDINVTPKTLGKHLKNMGIPKPSLPPDTGVFTEVPWTARLANLMAMDHALRHFDKLQADKPVSRENSDAISKTAWGSDAFLFTLYGLLEQGRISLDYANYCLEELEKIADRPKEKLIRVNPLGKPALDRHG